MSMRKTTRLATVVTATLIASTLPSAGSADEVEVRGSGPQAVLDAYRRAMEQEISDPQLAIYSERSRSFMAQRGGGSKRQMANTARSLNRCTLGSVSEQGDRAVIHGPVDERRCSPYFFVREDGQWRLDLATMARSIRMNQKNQWRLTVGQGSPYWFAFEDWELSDQGFPIAR